MKGKRILLFSLLFVLTVVFTVPVFAKAKIKLNRKTITIAPKQTVKLTVKVKGEKKKAKWKKAKWKNIKWSSSNKKIATVSKTGEVKGRKAGKVVIKAKVKGKTLKCKVTVTAASSKRKDSGSAPNVQSGGKTTFTFIQKGWYVARLEVEVWDKQKQKLCNENGVKLLYYGHNVCDCKDEIITDKAHLLEIIKGHKGAIRVRFPSD